MNKTVNELINEQYQALFGGAVSSEGSAVVTPEKSAVEKLQAINDCVSESSGVFPLEDEEEKNKFSKEKLLTFLMELASASDADLEIFKEMMALADDREALFLEIIKNTIFEEKEKIKVFLEKIIKKENALVGFIGYSHLAAILSDDRSDENKKRFHQVLVFEIGPTENIQNNSGAASPSASTSGSPYSSHTSSLLSPVSPSRTPQSIDYEPATPQTGSPSSSRYDYNSKLKEGRKQIVARLTTYLKMREENPLRNLFHNKELTKTKVENARELIGILNKEGVMAFASALKLSEINNRKWENAEHTYAFWKSSGGEYGKCLHDCCTILESEGLVLKEYKQNVITKILKLDLDRLVKNDAIQSVADAYSIKEVKENLGTKFPQVVEQLKSAPSSRQPSVNSSRTPRGGAMGMSD